MSFRLWVAAAAALLFLAALGPVADACPFCAAVSLTFCEEVGSSDVAVIARLVKLPADANGQSAISAGSSGESTKAKFEIVEVLKGKDSLGDVRTFETLFFGSNPVGSTFLVMGVEPPQINWATPIALSDRGRKYVVEALALPKEGPERLVFFQDFLEDADETLARDAYDEFAKTPYSAVKALKDKMRYNSLITWIDEPKIPASRRRLYLTMLGICGTAVDADKLAAMLRSDDRMQKSGLDAVIAAYLSLTGPEGMQLVEDLFLKNKEAEYVDTYAAIMALRFHGQEEKAIPRERLLVGIRYMLERPQLADLVIPDLARWKDWSVMDRLVTLFKEADDDSSWVRVPVINFLRACPLLKAKQYLDELAKIDPESVKKANSFFPLGTAAPAQKSLAPAEKSAAPTTDDKKTSSEAPAADAGAAESPKGKAPAASAGPKKSGGPASPPPGAKKTSHLDKRALENLYDRTDNHAVTGSKVAQLGRLSRSAGPTKIAEQVSRAWVAICLMLSACGLTAFLLLILRGGQRAILITSSTRDGE